MGTLAPLDLSGHRPLRQRFETRRGSKAASERMEAILGREFSGKNDSCTIRFAAETPFPVTRKPHQIRGFTPVSASASRSSGIFPNSKI
jgi:hypothetical protein